MDHIQLENGLLKLRQRARIAGAVIIAYVALSVASIIATLAAITGHVDLDPPGDLDTTSAIAVAALLVGFATFFVSVVAVSIWIHRAHANLVAAEIDGLEFTPGWSVGWFFVPIASLVKPFQAMRELWSASHDTRAEPGDRAPKQLSIWWGGYLVGGMLRNVSTRVPDEGSIGAILDIAGSIMLIASALCLLKIIREVTSAQSTGLISGDIFA